MNQNSNQTKAPYNSPQLERYGNVRDLTQTVISTATLGSDHHSTQRTH